MKSKPKLAKDRGMIEEGVMLINKGIKLSSHANEELNDINNTQDGVGLGCYMLVQAIELLIKGLVHCFGENTNYNHVIKPIARQLINICEHRVPELNRIRCSLDDLSDNAFTYIIHTWQVDGRYDFLEVDRQYIDKALNVCNDLIRFAKNYQLTEIKESYDFF